ncbi:MAG: thiamine diphosphokinase [Anaerolineae bacterium]|nr:thiamine diphosphokinase [Anaerolineae bacterium]
MRVFVVAGSPAAQQPIGVAPGPADRVMAADYGAHHALVWGWPIHLLIGDLDSLPEADWQVVRARSIPTITAPAAKDETDLELALAQALADGAHELIICAALGGRADHMLANVLLLARPELDGIPAAIVEGAQTVRLLRGGASSAAAPVSLTVTGAPGDLLTLLPLAGDALGITTAGLLYPLADEPLLFGRARGISNVLTASTAQIWLRTGLLLVIHTRQFVERS